LYHPIPSPRDLSGLESVCCQPRETDPVCGSHLLPIRFSLSTEGLLLWLNLFCILPCQVRFGVCRRKEVFSRQAASSAAYTKASKERLSLLSNHEYDRLLSNNLVLLNQEGHGVNDIMIDCIARNTPILVNPLDVTQEYLGKDYPL